MMGRATLMMFSVVHTFGSYSTTARSARRATLTEYMPGCVRSTPSIDCKGVSAAEAGARETHFYTRAARHALYSELAFTRSTVVWC